MDDSTLCITKVRGGRNFILKKFVKIQEEEFKEMIHALDALEQ